MKKISALMLCILFIWIAITAVAENRIGESSNQVELILEGCPEGVQIYRLLDSEGNKISHDLRDMKTAEEGKLYLLAEKASAVESIVAGEYQYNRKSNSNKFTKAEKYFICDLQVSWDPISYTMNADDGTVVGGGKIKLVNCGNIAIQPLLGATNVGIDTGRNNVFKIASNCEVELDVSIKSGNGEDGTIEVTLLLPDDEAYAISTVGGRNLTQPERISDTCYLLTECGQIVTIPVPATILCSPSIEIEWDDNNNQYNTRPTSLEANLTGGDHPIDVSVTDSWRAEVKNLPMQDADGKNIPYNWNLLTLQNQYTVQKTEKERHAKFKLSLLYPVEIDQSIEHGKVELETEQVKFRSEETVTLKVTPDDGYEVESVAMNGISIMPVDGIYSFVMPAQSVKITASFVLQNSGDADSSSTLSVKVNEGTFLFGEDMEIIVSLTANSHAVHSRMARFASPQAGQISLWKDGLQIAEPQTAQIGKDIVFRLNTLSNRLMPGSHTLTAKYIPTSGMGEQTAQISVAVDYLPEKNVPDAQVSGGNLGSEGWLNDDPVLTAPKGMRISLDPTIWSEEYGNDVTLSAHEGEHEYTYYIRNENGAVAKKRMRGKVDKTAPDIEQPTVFVDADRAEVIVLATDGISGIKRYELRQTGGNKAEITDNGSGSFTITGLTTGEKYTFAAIVTDKAGHTAMVEFVVTAAQRPLLPETGDDSQLVLYAILLCACVSGLSVVTKKRRAE